MEFTKTVTNYCTEYRLHPNEVFFAMLVNEGCGRAEAYAAIYNGFGRSKSANQNAAAELVRGKTGLAKLIADLDQKKQKAPTTPTGWGSYIKKGYKNRDKEDAENIPNVLQWDPKQTASENLQRIIEGSINIMGEGKEKADLAIRLAKLYGFSEEKTELVHYYLPLSCYQCSLYCQYKRDKKGND